MAHKLTIREDGKVEMFSGQNIVPWHKLGTVVPNLLTAVEAIKAAGLDWDVVQAPVFVEDKQVEDVKANVRSDNRLTLSIVGNRYTPIQNSEAFEFFDEIVGQGQAIYDTAGSLKGGRKVWIMAKLKGSLFIDSRPNDTIDKNVLLATSHDGTSSLTMQIVSTRVVCANTLSVALGEATNKTNIRHTKNYADKKAMAGHALGLCNAYFSDLQGVLNELARQEMNQDGMVKFTEELVPMAKDEKEATRTVNTRNDIVTLFSKGIGNLGKSRWDALNAVTQFVDHDRSTRTKGDKVEARFASAMFGSGYNLKEKLFNF